MEAGWAILQGILTTCLGMTPLIFINARIVRTILVVNTISTVLGIFTSDFACKTNKKLGTDLVLLPTIFVTFFRTERDKTRKSRWSRIALSPGVVDLEEVDSPRFGSAVFLE